MQKSVRKGLRTCPLAVLLQVLSGHQEVRVNKVEQGQGEEERSTGYDGVADAPHDHVHRLHFFFLFFLCTFFPLL